MTRHARRPARRGLAALLLAAAALAVAAASPAAAQQELMKPNPAVQKRLEEAMLRQPQMVAEALAKLEPERPGVRDIYFIGVAAWGDQDVFRLEVRSVRSIFERQFDARGRAVSLVNHRNTMDQAPLATHETIEAAIMGVAERMNREEDVLVLFVTSHGSEWDGVGLVLNGVDFGQLKTAQLARILGASRIRNRVVVVSACYSGQFVPALAEENTLLITASASDRNSFGCTNDAEWTWFGQAFFRDALPKHRNFQRAFDEAKDRIAAREKREGYTPSEPQFRMGFAIRAVLGRMGL